MTVKFACSKCSKRFVDWGADKIKAGDGCDDCKGEFLELIAFDSSKPVPKKKATLKRKQRVAVMEPEPPPEDVRVGSDDAKESLVPETTKSKG